MNSWKAPVNTSYRQIYIFCVISGAYSDALTSSITKKVTLDFLHTNQ